ncbi:hypothetical protein DSM03_104234 [Leeuwenhoekiella aestuarii]|uniref:Uncharacterized protein n=1 Tax=Leeuwenhoekiella aestuarii TaxID=2249426 RepID=A0A4Q0NTM2_9FLAO|nr:hypothetical protein DSM04_105166 [Leeuwenhoekiella aestuarii]RXG15076.1 hypothetical protein DSM03_104234 [Leeuwenhoekiella aestuarii]
MEDQVYFKCLNGDYFSYHFNELAVSFDLF